MSRGFLLDTNVISKFAPDRPRPSPALAGWMTEKGATDELFLSVMTIAEIRKGIRKLVRRGAVSKAEALQHWLAGILSTFEAQILFMDIAVALAAGEIEDRAIGSGHNPELGDVLIAATAMVNDLVVVTENIRHFEPFGIAVERPVAG